MKVSLFLFISFFTLITIGRGLSDEQGSEIILASLQELTPEEIEALLKRGQEVEDRLKEESRDELRTKLDALDDFALKLREWFLKNLIVKANGGRFSFYKSNVICFPRGCINISDVGVHP